MDMNEFHQEKAGEDKEKSEACHPYLRAAESLN
jgi:hypothetical protein